MKKICANLQNLRHLRAKKICENLQNPRHLRAKKSAEKTVLAVYFAVCH
jgi:hypothetical protein